MGSDVIAKLKEMAADPERVWIVGGASYAGLLKQTGRLANVLLSLGLKRGDRLLLQVEKCEAVLSLYLACLRAGVVPLGLVLVRQGRGAGRQAFEAALLIWTMPVVVLLWARRGAAPATRRRRAMHTSA